MKPVSSSIVSLVLVLIAVSSLASMISTLKIDSIVHGDLYRYGLYFNYGWAIPYWTMTIIVFGMGWFNIVVAVAFQFYVLIRGQKETLKSETSREPLLKLQPTKEEIIEIETKTTEKVEEHKEQESKPAEESEIETKETSTPPAETKEETQEKREETPILVGVPEEELQAAA